MNNQTLVSVVVPIYKVPEKYLRQCVESCINQTLHDLEIILVDDGSPDKCGEICDEYAKIDARIKVIHKENGGLAAARNSGVAASSGEWIMFVDGDDWIEAPMCQMMFQKTLDTPNLDLVMCEWVKDYNGKLQYFNFKFRDGQLFEKDDCDTLEGLMLNFDYGIATAYSKLINRQLLVKYKIEHDEDLRQGVEGVLFNLKLFDRVKKALFVKYPYYHYIYNNESISTKVNDSTIKMLELGFQRLDSYIQVKKNSQFLEKELSVRVLSGIITATLRGYFSPQNDYSFHEKASKLKTMLDASIYKKYMSKYYLHNNLKFSKKLVVLIIKFRLFRILQIFGILRHWQLEHK